MAAEKVGGGIVITGSDIERVRLLAVKHAMRLELRTGLTHSRGSVIAMWRKHLGLKGNRQSVYEQFCTLHGLPIDDEHEPDGGTR